MKLRLGERIEKAAICIIVAPFLMVILIILVMLMLLLPLVAFIKPDVIKVRDKK